VVNEQALIQTLSHGTSRSFSDLSLALAQAEKSHEDAVRSQRNVDASLIAAAATQWIVSDFASLAPLVVWSRRIANDIAVDELPDRNARLIHSAGLLAAHLFADASGLSGAQACVDSFRECLLHGNRALDANIVVSGAEHVASWMTNTGQQAAFDELSAVIEPYLEDERLGPFVRARWLFWLGTNQMYADQRRDAERTWLRAQQSVGSSSWPWLRFHLLRVTTRPLIEDARFEQAEHRLNELRGLVDFSRPLDVGDYHHLRGWMALINGDARVARQHYELAFDAAKRGALPIAHTAIYRAGLVLSLLSEGREDEAEQLVLSVPSIESARSKAVQDINLALIRACRSRRLGQTDYAKQLAHGLRLAREHGLLRFFRMAPKLAALLCADALSLGIESDFVTRAIQDRKLAPPSARCASWPWPVRVRVLGGFLLEVAGSDVDPSRRKPLDLLRAIVALGPLPCDVDALANELWPDAEGDVARVSLDTTLHRLRKMLGRPDALVLADGRVGLNRTLVWVDAWAFEDVSAAIDHATRTAAGSSAAVSAALCDELLSLYRGEFLGGSQVVKWAAGAADRWKTQFERAVRQLAAVLVTQKQQDQSERLYQLAIERDAFSEPLYRALMELLMSQARHAEAVIAFRRYREMLSIQLAMAPSASMVALAAQAAAAAQSGV
jgi:LuxR family maltose regulon positive regulatory protein